MKGENIPHVEKMISIFETCTECEWVAKGKFHSSTKLGKKLSITSNQYDLIVYHIVMDEEQNRDILITTANVVLEKYKKLFQ